MLTTPWLDQLKGRAAFIHRLTAVVPALLSVLLNL